MATDPICGMSVDERSAVLTLFRNGRTYYFCSESCRREFADPARALRALRLRLLVGWPLSLAVLVLQYLVRPPGDLYVQLALAGIVQAWAGGPFYRGTWDALRTRIANMDVLVAVGSTLAYGYSAVALLSPGTVPDVTFFDASALIVTLILTGHYLEQATRSRASSALSRLPGLLPRQVEVYRGGASLRLTPAEVEVGDLVVVPPGGRVPADGRIVSGTSELDESLLTGESRPVRRGPGERVVAGSVNHSGRLEVAAERVGEETFLSEVGRLIEEAEGSRMPLRQMADRISERFVPFVLLVGIAAAVGWSWLGVGLPFAVLVLVSVIITACPCAFGIATPAAILVGTGRAAEEGVLYRGSDAIERAARVDLVLADKTGTLTTGTPRLTEVITGTDSSETEVLQIAAGLEASIPHPWAHAVREAARERSIGPAVVHGVRVRPGEGVEGMIGDRAVSLRSGPSPAELGPLGPAVARLEHEGRSWSAVYADGKPLGVLAFAEALRPGVRATVERLRAEGIPVVLVTGDSEASARAVAEAAGIGDLHARVSPSGKLELLRQARAAGRHPAFVGDGVNDAPALAAAELGIAVGTGTEVARDAGNVLLVRPDFAGVETALTLGRRTVAKVRQNLGWAIGYNAILLPVAAGVLVPITGLRIFFILPIAGALAMGLSSTIVVANSLSLRRNPIRPASPGQKY